jgi:hypothetical protein
MFSNLIDPALEKAGWNLEDENQVGFEIPVDGYKAQVKGNKYDLSASRYRQIEQDEAFYDSPQVTMERLLMLENVMASEVKELMSYLDESP